jgi:hypothetical protein
MTVLQAANDLHVAQVEHNGLLRLQCELKDRAVADVMVSVARIRVYRAQVALLLFSVPSNEPRFFAGDSAA